MNDKEAGQYWNENAIAWTTLARAGFDIYRDYLNTPAFFGILPDIHNLSGIDIGCGEGYNTRLLAQKAAQLTAVDIADNFIQKAIEAEKVNPLNIEYIVASATQLPFENDQFDFATSFMCLMDIPKPEKALQEAFKVLKPNGFLQFSITHPCFTTPHRKNLRDAISRKTYAIEVEEAPADLKNKFPKFKTPIFNRTLTQWFAAILNAGFIIEQLNEPYPDINTVHKHPSLQDAQLVAYFLHIRCRKPIGLLTGNQTVNNTTQ